MACARCGVVRLRVSKMCSRALRAQRLVPTLLECCVKMGEYAVAADVFTHALAAGVSASAAFPPSHSTTAPSTSPSFPLQPPPPPPRPHTPHTTHADSGGDVVSYAGWVRALQSHARTAALPDLRWSPAFSLHGSCAYNFRHRRRR
eukprot:1264046-Pleurochrysis_carterae.AAC.2